MSDLSRFDRMTRPIKFRRLKMVQMYLKSLATRTITSVIYGYYNILYKLHIYNRYNYRDMADRTISSPFSLPYNHVGDNVFSATVGMNFVERHYVSRDYFYKKCRDGKEKIVYKVEDVDRTELYAVTKPYATFMKFNGDAICLNDKPTLKIFQNFIPTDFDNKMNLSPNRTITIDLKPVRELVHKQMIGVDRKIESLSNPEVLYYYEFSCNEIRKYLNRLSISDLEVKRC